MDDSAIKSPTSVALVHLESNAVHEKQLSLGGADAMSTLASAASICVKVISVGVTITFGEAHQPWPAKSSIAFHSAGVNLIFAAATFSSRCAIDDVPGIGSITADRWRSQDRATWTTLTPWFLAAVSTAFSGFNPLPPPIGNHGMNPRLSFSQRTKTFSDVRS